MSRKQLIILILVLAAAFLLRLAFVPAPGYEKDIQNFKNWSKVATQYGVHEVYNKSWCDYLPGYLYVLKSVGLIYQNFYPDFEENTYLFNFLIKFPAILADILLAGLIFWLLRKKYSYKISLIAMAVYVFNPVIFFNSAYWGQVDSVPLLVAVVAVSALVHSRIGWAWGLSTFAFLLKPQMVLLFPVVVLVSLKNYGWKQLINGLMVAWTTFFVVLLPFYYFKNTSQVMEKILGNVGAYPYLSLNAYNFWWLVSWGRGRWVSDTISFFGVFSYRTFGNILLAIFFVVLLRFLFKRTQDEKAVYLACALSFFAFFMLPTEMHERYIIPMFAFLLLAAVENKGLKVVFGILTMTAFLNIYMALARTYPGNFPLTASFWQAFPGDILASILNVAVLIYFLAVLLKGINLRKAARFGLVGLIVLILFYSNQVGRVVYLSDLKYESHIQEWGELGIDRSVDGNRLTVNGFIFKKGLGSHANSTTVFDVGGRFRVLEGYVGVDDEWNKGNKVRFLIYADDRSIFDSGIVEGWKPPRYLRVSVADAKKIRLVVNDGGDSIRYDHADWLQMKLLP